ncbi:hypothetical protein Purlil1_2568 [Purpureocillium lilacinum]|uniref:Uncharacterized protein n=1 Tax=Purpureocillium lilacinum TaxID=33203 RepID=A0ABR0CBH1_PURLI|nr:hypothetical protein Purlil1_2568 [Purpureocillium lilacinum]
MDGSKAKCTTAERGQRRRSPLMHVDAAESRSRGDDDGAGTGAGVREVRRVQREKTEQRAYPRADMQMSKPPQRVGRRRLRRRHVEVWPWVRRWLRQQLRRQQQVEQPSNLGKGHSAAAGVLRGGSSGLHPPDTRPRRRATEVPQVAPPGLTAPAHLGRQGGPVRAVRRSARGKGEGEASSAFPSMAPDCTPPPAADGAMIAVANAPQSSHNATRVRALAGQGKSTQKRRGSWEMRGAGPVSWSAVNEQAGKHAASLEAESTITGPANISNASGIAHARARSAAHSQPPCTIGKAGAEPTGLARHAAHDEVPGASGRRAVASAGAAAAAAAAPTATREASCLSLARGNATAGPSIFHLERSEEPWAKRKSFSKVATKKQAVTGGSARQDAEKQGGVVRRRIDFFGATNGGQVEAAVVRMRAFSSARHGGGFEETASQWVDGRRRSVSSTEGSEEAGARTGGRTRPSSFACQAGNQVDKRYGEYSKGEAERRERRELGDGAAGWKMQAPGLSRGSAQSVVVQCPGWLADGRLQLAAVARGELRSGAEVREGTHLRCWHQQRR